MEPETETTSQTRTIRIFISSPGDVAAERDKAKQVIAQLQKWYGPAVNLVPVLWEEMPLEIDSSFQNGIDVILGDQGIDIAVFILWSRLGTPVTVGDKTYNSGTEREFDLMLHALEASGDERPDILFYRRDDDTSFDKRLTQVDDDEKLDLFNQKRLAKEFLRENFWDEQGQNTRAYHSFHQPVEFAGRLKVHLQGLIDRRLEVQPEVEKQSGPGGLTFSRIPGGTFRMGSPEGEEGLARHRFAGKETPHTVTLTQDFWISETPVTQRQWMDVMGGDNPSHFTESGKNAPKEPVSWEDAVAFCAKLNEMESGLRT